jgi:signal transduction histidine kinase
MLRRSILWMIPIVLIAVGVMLGMQYRFLRRLEETSIRAERDARRSSVDQVARDVEQRFRDDVRRAIDFTPAELESPEASARRFATTAFAPAASWFTVDFDSHDGMRYFDRSGRAKEVSQAEMVAVKVTVLSWMVQARDRVPMPSRVLTSDAHDPRNRVVALPIVDANGLLLGAAGVVLDEARLRTYLKERGVECLKKQGSSNYFTLRVGEPRVFGATQGERVFLTQPLGFAFSDWRIGVRNSCLSPEELAACSFRTNMLWTGGAALVLLLAIGLAMQAAWRQERLSQMKSDFVSNVSHELRTPLASIRVFGEYMRLGRVTNPEKVREYGDYIETESRRLTALINNILDFSKIESAEKKYNFVETDLAEVVRQSAAAFETPLRDHDVKVEITLPREPLPMMLVDRGALAQALVNLLDNAIKYSGDSKWVMLAVTTDRDHVRISVRDRGIGIAPCEQKKIFDKFYRVGSSLVHDVKGSGLGLSIVKHIALAHGGEMQVESVPGEGSTFTIVLPRKRCVHVAEESITDGATRVITEGHA